MPFSLLEIAAPAFSLSTAVVVLSVKHYPFRQLVPFSNFLLSVSLKIYPHCLRGKYLATCKAVICRRTTSDLRSPHLHCKDSDDRFRVFRKQICSPPSCPHRSPVYSACAAFISLVSFSIRSLRDAIFAASFSFFLSYTATSITTLSDIFYTVRTT